MSCCGGKCGCGANCTCDKNCTGCKRYEPLFENETVETKFILADTRSDMSEFSDTTVVHGDEENFCKCGDNCNCSPCTCNK